ncbi:hypothetical protein VI03_18720 [Burkholderia vietnamiensis]|nr:hypothetical protein VI03_18720 [Burkholderia vietnamiensis]
MRRKNRIIRVQEIDNMIEAREQCDIRVEIYDFVSTFIEQLTQHRSLDCRAQLNHVMLEHPSV